MTVPMALKQLAVPLWRLELPVVLLGHLLELARMCEALFVGLTLGETWWVCGRHWARLMAG